MTKTLTEQWREETLPEGLYYIEGKGTHDIALIRNRYCPVLTSPYCEDDVFESEFVPVAPVPSYDKVKEMSQRVGRLELDNGVLDDELKELATKNDTLAMENGRLENKLAIATKALKDMPEMSRAQRALREMEGVK